MNRTSAVVALVAVALAATLLCWPEVVPGERLASTARETSTELRRLAVALREHPDSVALPAPLSGVHACLEELDGCQQCHTWTHGVPDSKCLRCHELVGARLAAGSGYHGRLRGTCASCHKDHDRSIIDFDREAFNHAQALYPLEGKHAAVDCADCHEGAAECPTPGRRMRYLGLAFATCDPCHDDPHGAQFETTLCDSCHSVQGSLARR